jgi:hypothetical protein
MKFFLQDFLPLAVSNSASVSHLPTQRDSKAIQTTDENYWMPYREWRDQQKKSLSDFLTRRLTETNSDEDEQDDDDDFEDAAEVEDECNDVDIHHMTQTQPETQPMLGTQPETQPMLQPMIEEDAESLFQRPPKRQKRPTKSPNIIPHINETLHDVSKLQYVDLYTQTLHLPLCRVIKVWDQRNTKRGVDEPFQHIRRPCPKYQHTAGAMYRIPFGHMEEDGPVASAYTTVLSMEVEQLMMMETSGPTATSFPTCRKRRRVKLFFYNVYAEAVAEWIHQQRKKKLSDFVMSLSHIPAICIFPRAINVDNWLESHEMVEYCICIGGTSNARADGAFIRFDDDMFLIKMASQSILRNHDDIGEITTLPEELVLSQWHCNANYFLSSSDKRDDFEGRTNVIVSIQQVWSRFFCQRQQEKEQEQRSGEHQTFIHEQDVSGRGQPVGIENHAGNLSEPEKQHTEIHTPLVPMVIEGSAKREQNDVVTKYIKLVSNSGFHARLLQYVLAYRFKAFISF